MAQHSERVRFSDPRLAAEGHNCCPKQTSKSISVQFLLKVAILLLAIGGGVNYWFYTDSKIQLNHIIEKEATEKLNHIASLTDYYLFHFENELIAELGKSVMLDKKVKYLSIAGTKRRPYFKAGNLKHKNIRLFKRTILRGVTRIGTIELGLDMTDHLNETQKTLWFTISSVLFTIFSLGGAIFLFFRTQVLVQMEHVEQEEALLRQSALELERRVDERTRDLVLSNKKLNQNVQERLQVEQALHKEKEQLQVTLQSIREAVITTDAQGKVTFLNPIAEQLTGWKNGEAKGKLPHQLYTIIDELSGQTLEDPAMLCLRHGVAESVGIHNVLINRYGKHIAIINTAAPMHDHDNNIIGSVLAFRDVSEERKLRQQLMHQAKHDELTGLVNRREFEACLIDALIRAKEESAVHAVIYLDLDQFKVVNDTCGHVAGDALLKQLTMLLRAKIRLTDTLSRLGGDEFGVILNNCSLKQAHKVSVDLLETIRDFRFIWDGKPFELGVSIGLVMVDEESKDISSIMSAADLACYAAKDLGRNRVHIYEESDEDLAKRHGEMHWVSMISQALKEDRFILYKQEIQSADMVQDAEKHFEVLIRMRGDDGKIIPPGAFLPAAERYNLMPSVDRWVIRTLFTHYARHRCDYSEHGNHLFSINLSGSTISDESMIDYICEQADAFRIPPEAICFEITETVAVANLTKANIFIAVLKEKGFRFSLDDFGCGVSTFSYLKNLPVDYLKIDGGFVKDMVQDKIDHAMVSAINDIGHVMNIKTIAEFVENDDTLVALKKLNVDYVQGFFLHKPSPL